MNLIVLLVFSSICFEGNPQLLRYPRFLSKLQSKISDAEPYEIQSKKVTLLGEKQTKLKPQEIVNNQISEKVPQISVQNNYPRNRINYKNNKTHIHDEPTIHMDIENAIIDYEKNDTIETQKNFVEIETLIIKHTTNDTNLLDSSLNYEDHNDNDFGENTNNTRRLITDTQNQTIEPVSSSTLNDLSEEYNEILQDGDCTSNIKTEETDSEDFDENLKKDMPTSGRGIKKFVKSRMMLFNHPRACYACNSIRDRSCWSPNRTTPVKYCRRKHKYCLTKVYERKDIPEVIRDCGESCTSTSTVTTGQAYSSCTVCQTDLCNSAVRLSILNIVCIVIVAINIIIGFSKPF